MAGSKVEVLRRAIEVPEGAVLLVDRAGEPARALWQTSFRESGRACVLVALDRPAVDYGRPERATLTGVLDVFTEGEGALPRADAMAFASRVTTLLGSTTSLYIDNIGSAVAAYGLTTILHLLADWEQKAAAVVSLVHADELDAFAVSSLERASRAIIRVGEERDAPVTLRGGRQHVHCSVTLFLRTGKVIHEESTLALLPGGRVAFRTETIDENEEEEAVILSAPPQPPPPVDVSFNLSLTDAQREARAQVVLPYMRAQQSQQPAGSVTYHLDAEDDFDEEDPDDDLDI